MQLNNVFLLPCIGWELGGGSLREGERGFVVDDCIIYGFLHI